MIVYVDGSSRGNPGRGGFGVVIFEDEDETRILYARSSQYDGVTNNQMELAALLCALDYIEDYYPTEEVVIYSDSKYVVRACNEWMRTWSRNNWITTKNQPVENQHLMKPLWNYFKRGFFHCELRHCHGHEGIVGNELADFLARGNFDKFYAMIDEYNISLDKLEDVDRRDSI